MISDAFEVLRPDLPRGRFRAVLFDFDGTLSLIRGGWMGIMIPMMLEALRATGTSETKAQLTALVEDFVMANNGRPTIFQMMRLVEEIQRRGQTPLPAEAYLKRYDDELMARVQLRAGALEQGTSTAESWRVPGCHALLAQLKRRGLHLYLASGTEVVHVRREAELLELVEYFGSRIHGPGDEDPDFSKGRVVDNMVAEHGLQEGELLGFGDGPVEIQEIRRVGGVAVAVASDEIRREGINPWKRDCLVAVGADLVIPDYREHKELLRYLFAEE